MLKTLSKSIRQYTKQTVTTPCIMVVESAMEILIPYVMSLLLRVLQTTQELHSLLLSVALYGGIMAVMALISMGAGVLGGKLAAEASAGFAANLRQDAYEKIQKYSFSNLDKFSTSSLITRLTTDVTNVQMAYQMMIRMMVRAPIMFVFASVMSFVVNPSIAWLFIASAVVMALVVVFVMSKAIPQFQKMIKKYDKLNSVAQENLTAVRVVKSFVREPYEAVSMQCGTHRTRLCLKTTDVDARAAASGDKVPLGYDGRGVRSAQRSRHESGAFLHTFFAGKKYG